MALPGALSACEPLQELSGPSSDFGLSGDEASNTSFEGFPDLKVCPEALLSAARIRILSSAAAVSVVTTSGCNVVPLFHSCLVDLRWWSKESHLFVRLPPGLPQPNLALYTDDSGWGRLPSRRPSVRLVASVLFDVINQPLGTPCGVLRSSGISSSPSWSFRVPLCGQCDRSVVSLEAGRDSLLYPELYRPVDSSPLRSPSDPHGSTIHSGQTECVSRLS